MIAFKVEDMRTRRSATLIVEAVKALDHRANVRVDLGRHLVEIEPAWTESCELSEAIERAGFTPAPIVRAAQTPCDWPGNGVQMSLLAP